jgi:hypothetical protein
MVETLEGKNLTLELALFIAAIIAQLVTTLVLYEVKFKMFTVIKFFFLPMGALFALSLYVLAIKLSK